jgi:polysaccharide pyruvyl transferase WcaK-like protein
MGEAVLSILSLNQTEVIGDSMSLAKNARTASGRSAFCLLGASYNTGNRGVSALVSGTINAIKSSFSDAEIFLADYDRTPSRHRVLHANGHADVELLNLRFSKTFWLPNNIARLLLTALLLRGLPVKAFRRRCLAKNPYLRRIAEADVVGAISGGDSFSDIYGLQRLIYVSLPQILVLLLGRPLVQLPQTYGPFKGGPARFIARWILSRSHSIHSRDRESIAVVQELLDGQRVQPLFSYDLGFVLEPHIEPERVPPWLAGFDHGRALVGLNVSGLLYVGGYNRKNMFGLKGDYRELIRELIQYFILVEGVDVMLVPHVFGTTADGESDLSACREIWREMGPLAQGRLHVLEEDYEAHQIKALIGRCDFFLGSRMHACIAALSQGVPAIGLAYSRKFRGVFSSIDMEELVIDLCDDSPGSAREKVAVAFQRRTELRARLQAKMPVVRKSVLGLFARVVENLR